MYDVPDMRVMFTDFLWRKDQGIGQGVYLQHLEGFALQINVDEIQASLIKLRHSQAKVYDEENFFPAGYRETWE